MIPKNRGENFSSGIFALGRAKDLSAPRYNHSQGSFVTLSTTKTLLFVIGIVTELWAGGLRVSIPAREKNVIYQNVQTGSEVHPSCIQCVPRVLSSEIKRPGRETDHTPFSAEAKNKRNHICPVLCPQSVHRDALGGLKDQLG